LCKCDLQFLFFGVLHSQVWHQFVMKLPSLASVCYVAIM